MGNTIYASFNDPGLAEKAAGALLDHGVRPEDISVVRSHNGEVDTSNYGTTTVPTTDTPTTSNATLGTTTGGAVSADPNLSIGGSTSMSDALTQSPQTARNHTVDANGTTTGYGTTDNRLDAVNHPDVITDTSEDTENTAKHGISTTTAGDAGAGALKGTAWGLGIGAVAVLASLFVPGVGLVVGGGALASALGAVAASAGAGAAAGAVTGYLKDQGIDDQAAHQYGEAVSGGGAILAVSLPSGTCDESEGRSILEKYGAINVNSYSAGSGYVA
jgi:uncharacterized membrane protein